MQNKDMDKIFFDNASTTKLDERVFEEMLPFLKEEYGNPSSFHSFGEIPDKKMEESRNFAAELVGSKADEIYFTSCGTESNNMALWGIARAYKDKGKHIITSAVEHYSILNPLKEMQKDGWEVTVLPVDSYGSVDPADVKKAIRNDTVLISIMHANNEIGTIQNIKDIFQLAKAAGIVTHSDCVATAGIIPLDVNQLGIDSCSFTAQQMYGPKGAAALYLKKGIRLRPLLIGGVQERGRRAGTENVAAIAGLGKACQIAKAELENNISKLTGLRDILTEGILNNIKKVRLNGHPKIRLPGNVHISFEYVEGESITLLLNSQGIAVSSGSSCASAALKTSHVLNAIKLPPAIANGSILFALGRYNTIDEVRRALDVLPPVIEKLRKMSPLATEI